MGSLFAKLIEPKNSFPEERRLFSNAALKALIIPLIIEQILAMMVGVADTMMISYAGEAAISGVSLVDMINGVVIYLFSALATGGTIVVSQYIGNKEQERGRKAASQLVMFSAVLALVMMLAIQAGNRGLLHLLFSKAESSVIEAAYMYLLVTSFSFPFLAVYNACAALFRAMGNSKITMRVSLLMNVVNVIGNSIGIFVFHAGVFGVAFASLVSRILAAVVLFVRLVKNKGEITLNMKDLFSFDGSLLWKILRIAVPNGLESGIFQVTRVVQTSLIAMFGTAQIAANGVAVSIDNINNIIMASISLAVPAVVGRCIGGKDYDQGEYYTRKLLRTAVLGTLLLCTCMTFALPQILKLYSLSEETIHYVYILVLIHAFFSVTVSPFSGTLGNAIRATGDVRFVMMATMISVIAARLPLSFFFGLTLNLGIVGMWMAMVSQWMVQAAFNIYRFLSGKWRNFSAID